MHWREDPRAALASNVAEAVHNGRRTPRHRHESRAFDAPVLRLVGVRQRGEHQHAL